MKAGKIVKLLRVAEGLSQGGLAQMLDVTQTHLSQVEKGRKPPSLALLKSIAEVLKVPVALLMVDSTSAPDSAVMKKLQELVVEVISARVAAGDLRVDEDER